VAAPEEASNPQLTQYHSRLNHHNLPAQVQLSAHVILVQLALAQQCAAMHSNADWLSLKTQNDRQLLSSKNDNAFPKLQIITKCTRISSFYIQKHERERVQGTELTKLKTRQNKRKTKTKYSLNSNLNPGKCLINSIFIELST